MTTPQVTVAIAVYNGAPFLRQALDSVLASTNVELEIVASDDCSKDDSLSILQHYAARDARIRVAQCQKNLGMVGNWNAAVSMASAPLVKLMGQDDLLAPDALARQCAALEKSTESAFAVGPCSIVDRDGELLFRRVDFFNTGERTLVEAVDSCRALGGNAVGEPVAITFRKRAFDDAGGFRTKYRYVTDIDMWLRLLRGGHTMIYDTREVGHFRVHGEQESARATARSASEVLSLLRDFGVRPSLSDDLRVHARSYFRAAFLRLAGHPGGRSLLRTLLKLS